MFQLAHRVEALKGSAIMEMSAKAAEMKARGVDVISLAAGEPDMATPIEIQRAATKAMSDGITKYTPAQGFLALREALSEKLKKENDLSYSPKEIVVCSGAKHAISLTLQCLLNPGDHVLIPTPAWVSYKPMVELCGASVIPLPTYEEDSFQPNVDRWKGLSIPATAKGIILNSPSNPIGIVYSKKVLKDLASWALQRNLWIISDEIYEKITFDDHPHFSLAALGPEVKEHTITISGFSKCFAMTGWRLGWACAPEELISRMAALQSQTNSHVTSFVQWAAITAAKLPADITTQMVVEFDKRRHYIMSRLDAMKAHLSYPTPTGAFYVFINLSPWLKDHGMTDVEFSKVFLDKSHVGVVPGSMFGKENYIRISYATSLPQLEKAMDRLESFLSAT